MSETVAINPNKLYTKSEYSRRYNISRVTIDKKIAEGTLKAIKINGTILIKSE